MTTDVPVVQRAPTARMRVGVLGAGMIATIGYGYLPHLGKIRDRVELTAIADRRLDLARAVAEAHEIGRAVITRHAHLEQGFTRTAYAQVWDEISQTEAAARGAIAFPWASHRHPRLATSWHRAQRAMRPYPASP